MIAFRADGNKDIGMGHLMRCSTLYKGLIKKGEKALFLVSPDSDTSFLDASGFESFKLKDPGPRGWSVEETISFIERTGTDLLVVDSYRITGEELSALRKHVRLAYIDDLYSYDADADIIININIDAREELYAGKGDDGRKICAGIKYYPLREEFFPYIASPIRKEVKTVLITTGSTDPFHCAYQITDTLKSFSDIRFIVLIGAFYPEAYTEELKTLIDHSENVTALSWGGNIAETLSECDLLVSSGSSTVLEALSVGVPCITFQFAENHRTECDELQKLQMAPFAGVYDSCSSTDTNDRLIQIFRAELEYETRKNRHNIFAGVFDGKGAERITKILSDAADKKTVQGEQR